MNNSQLESWIDRAENVRKSSFNFQFYVPVDRDILKKLRRLIEQSAAINGIMGFGS